MMIKIDQTGVCDLCISDQTITIDRENIEVERQQLTELLKNTQGSGHRQYDALVLFSGGKDSTYMVARIKAEFPLLRILMLTIDNGFMSTVARQNVQDLVTILDVDHVLVRPAKKFYMKLFKYCLQHLGDSGGYETLDFSDGEFLLDTARRIAAEKFIPIILCGFSRYQVQLGLKLHYYESPRNIEVSTRTAVAGLPLKNIFSDVEIKNWWDASRWPQDQIARLIFPLYAWDVEENKIKEAVVRWGLMSSREHSPIVTNHRLIPVIGVIDVHRRGYSSFEPEFCRMIREGRAKRHEWQMIFEFLEYTSRTGLFVKALVTDTLAELGLSPAEVGIKFEGAR
jgi:hypothetical protein